MMLSNTLANLQKMVNLLMIFAETAIFYMIMYRTYVLYTRLDITAIGEYN